MGWFSDKHYIQSLVVTFIIAIQITSFSCKAPAPEAQAAFEVVSLGVDPYKAATGQEITVTARIANIGNAQGTYTATLIVDGEQVEQKDVTIAPDAAEWVTYKIVRDAAATYLVNVGDMSTIVVVGYPTYHGAIPFIQPKLPAETVTKNISPESGFEIPQGTKPKRAETYDDIVSCVPGLVNYRANCHYVINNTTGEVEWVRGPDYIQEAQVIFSGCEFAPRVTYRGHIETKAGQIRYNFFFLELLDKSYLQYAATETALEHYSIKLAGTVPDIQVKNVESLLMGFGTFRLINLMIDISPQVKPGDYTLYFILDDNGQNCGKLPCVIHVTE